MDERIYEQLKVWQLAHKFALQVYSVTKGFPAPECYGLVSQVRRAAVSIPTNVVEGNARASRREYAQYCNVARSSTAELRYLLRISRDLGLVGEIDYRPLEEGYSQVEKMLQGLINSLMGKRRDSHLVGPSLIPGP